MFILIALICSTSPGLFTCIILYASLLFFICAIPCWSCRNELCTVVLPVCVCVCVCYGFNSLYDGLFDPKTIPPYSACNYNQLKCGIFSEISLLQRSSTSYIVRLSVQSIILFYSAENAHAHYSTMHHGFLLAHIVCYSCSYVAST